MVTVKRILSWEGVVRSLMVIVVVGVVGWGVIIAHRNAERTTQYDNTARLLGEATRGVAALARETHLHPGGAPLNRCVVDVEVSLATCAAGLRCTDGRFPSWRGPYVSGALTDAWGNPLRFDGDYRCVPQVQGCEGKAGWVRALVAVGPDGASGTIDDMVVVLCREGSELKVVGR